MNRILQNIFIHQWKEKTRSAFWQKSIFLNIFLGILALYLALDVLAIGYFADKIILEIYKDSNVVKVFTSLLFYYFSFDLILRFLFQQLPILSIQPYLTLPIKKKSLLHYPLLKSLFSFFNILALLLFLPFFIKNVCPSHSFMFSFIWIVTVLSLIFLNNYLNFSFKKYFSQHPLLILSILACFAISLYLDHSNIVSFSGYFLAAINFLVKNYFLVGIPVTIGLLSYSLAYNLLKRNAYIEDKITHQRKSADGLLFLNRFGQTGILLRNEVKMIFRNRRPKSVFFISLVFLCYGFVFYSEKNLNSYWLLSFFGVFMTSMFAINYSQYMFSWESSFFDSILVNRISTYNYIRSKYFFFMFSSLISFLVTLPYAFISLKIGYINAAVLLYNIGISSIILMFFCTFNTSRIDLGKGQFMNYEGTGLTQFLVLIPVMGFPVLFYFIFKYLGIAEYNFYGLGILGAIAIIFNKYLLQMITSQFEKRKYKMAVGFRKK